MCVTQWKLCALVWLKAAHITESGKLNYTGTLGLKRERNLLTCSAGLKQNICTRSPASFTHSWQGISPTRKWSSACKGADKFQHETDAQSAYSDFAFPKPQ